MMIAKYVVSVTLAIVMTEIKDCVERVDAFESFFKRLLRW